MSGDAFALAWCAALDARGIVCDAARRQRIAQAAPYLERIRERVREWRTADGDFDARVAAEHKRAG